MQKMSERLCSLARIARKIVADTQICMSHARHGISGGIDKVHEMGPTRNEKRRMAEPVVMRDCLVSHQLELDERLIKGTGGRRVGSRDVGIEAPG